MPKGLERDLSTYNMSPRSIDRMARRLAAKAQPYVKGPIAKFLSTVAQIPEVRAVAVEVFPHSNHVAVEWTTNIGGDDSHLLVKHPEHPKKNEIDYGFYRELTDGSVAHTYNQPLVKAAKEVLTAFGQLRDTLRPSPRWGIKDDLKDKVKGKDNEGDDKKKDDGEDDDEGKSKIKVLVYQPAPDLNEISTLHYHNNPGGNPEALIKHYKTRRQMVAGYPSTTPLNARSSFIALGIITHPAPITQLADVQPKDTTLDKSLAVTFVGQGSQKDTSARLKELAQRYMMAAFYVGLADEVLDYPSKNKLSKLMFQGPAEELTRTEHAQPAIYVATYTNFRILRALGLLNEPAVLAGSSLGEYTAHAVAGTFGPGIDGFVEGLKIVRQRGILMQEADDQTGPSGLMSVPVDTTDSIKLGEFINELNHKLGITKLDDENRVVATNINSDDQLIIGAAERTLRQLKRLFELEKIKARRLEVNAAFHSFFMAFAGVKMGEFLQGVTIYPVQDPDRFVFANATGKRVQTADEIIQSLTNQVDATTLYRDDIAHFPALGVTRVVEPGSSVQNGINSGFYEKRGFQVTKGKLILPGNITGADYTDLAPKAA